MKALKTFLMAVLLTLGTALFLTTSAQETYLEKNWTRDNLNSIPLHLLKPIESSYQLTGLSVYDKRENAAFEFTNKEENVFYVDLKKGIINADSDLKKQGNQVIDQVIITGFYPDIFKVYKDLFNKEANFETIKTAGAAPVMSPQANQTIAFYRGSASHPKPEGYWTIWIRHH